MTELRYHTTAHDYIALFNRYASGSVVAQRFVRAAFVVIPALAWLSTFLFYTRQGAFNSRYLYSGAFALFLTLSLPKLYDAYQTAFWRSVVTEAALQGLIGPTVLTISDDGIEETTPNVQVRAKWNEIERIEETKEHVFIYVASLLAMVVPRHAFANESDYRSFQERIQRCHAASRNASLEAQRPSKA